MLSRLLIKDIKDHINWITKIRT